MIYQDSKKITIIMVDDEPGLRDVFDFFIEQAKKDSRVDIEFKYFGCSRACDDYFASKERGEKENIFVISDINMPERDGITFIKELVSKHPYVNTIFCTAYHSDAFRRVCTELGAFAFFAKPADYAIVVQKILESAQAASLVA
ncbi:MAG: hypothetical protein CME69_11065 [Halobacteriovorax sp.]|nr:hypothetical protein [Halobacteriovorax sp.]